MARIFIGLDVTDNVEKALTRLEYGLEDMNWVDPKNFHLTLRFLDDLNAEQIDAVKYTLSKIVFAPFTMDIDGVGYFRKGSKCTALWASIAENDDLMNLVGTVNAQFESPLSLTRFFKSFTPHITLARPKKHKVKDVQSFIDHNQIFQIRDIPVNAFYLYESHITDKGADYEILETYSADAAAFATMTKELEDANKENAENTEK